jgi:hypothetical protein
MQKSKKGGNLTSELSKLSVPFGLVLAQKSLESYLDKKRTESKKTPKSSNKKTPKSSNKKTPKSSNKNPLSTNTRKKTLVTSI